MPIALSCIEEIDAIRAMNILRRTDSEIFLEHSASIFLLIASQANCFLLLISSVVPSKLSRYSQVLQL